MDTKTDSDFRPFGKSRMLGVMIGGFALGGLLVLVIFQWVILPVLNTDVVPAPTSIEQIKFTGAEITMTPTPILSTPTLDFLGIEISTILPETASSESTAFYFGVSEDYPLDHFLIEHINLYNLSPEVFIAVVETVMEELENPLDIAEGYVAIGSAYVSLLEYEAAEDYYNQAFDIVSQLELDSMDLYGFCRGMAVEVAVSELLFDYEIAESAFFRMDSEIYSTISSIEDVRELAGCYWYLIDSANRVWEWEKSEQYLAEMDRVVLSALEGIDDPMTLGVVYTYLIQSAAKVWDVDLLSYYSQQLVAVLKPYRFDVLTDEQVVRLSMYLGWAEYYSGNFQFAAVYFKELISYQKTSWNVFFLAMAYNSAGNHECAYKWFKNLLILEQEEGTDYFLSYAEDTIDHIEEACFNCNLYSCP